MPGRAIGRARFDSLLASSSVAALLLGGGVPSASAACNTSYNNTSAPGCTNAAAITGIAINNSNINGAINNAGTIGPNGIVLTNGSTVIGGINDTGTISGGISVDGTSAIGASGAAIAIAGPTFAGGITNAGEIVTDSDGIKVSGAVFSNGIINSGAIFASATGISIAGSTFTGGIANSGTVTASVEGIGVAGVSMFLGGVTNSGTITATVKGIGVASVGAFFGGITNIGTISVRSSDAIRVQAVSTFSGGIVNSGTVSGPVAVLVFGVSTFGNGISNSGTISALGTAIGVASGSVFSGGITNSGTVSSAAASGIAAVSISTFSGGMTNNGTIFASVEGMSVQSMSTFSGDMINSGAISAAGSGIVVAGVSTFLGGVTNSGQISAGARNGIAVTQVVTFAGGIGNSGTISASGTSGIGIQVAQVTSFAAGISNSGAISSGRYGIFVGATNTSSVSNFSGGVANSGTITAAKNAIEASLVSTFSGDMINSGGITAGSDGIAISGVSTFLGGITNTGTISAAHGIVISGTTGVSVFDSGTIIGSSGFAINFSTGPNTLTLGPGFDIQGKVVGSGTDIFQLGGTGSGNFNLASIGGGLQYEGFTSFNVVGAVWNATGTFGQAQAWTVNGGTLAGTGSFQSINVNAGGTLEPGTPGAPGTVMTINGNLAFASGAAYLVNLSPTTASRADVTGGVTLSGVVQGYFAPGIYNKATTYDILDPSSISGTFTGFTAVNLPGFGGTLTYQANDVLLTLTAQLGSGDGLNVNQQNVANAINSYFNTGGTLPPGFLPLFGLSDAALGHALSQLSGEPATDAGKGANQLMSDFLNLMLDPTAGGGGGVNGGGANTFAPEQDASLPADVALAYAKALNMPLKAPQPNASAQSFDQRWTAWGSGFGGASFTKGNAAIGSNNVTASDDGFAAGLDYHATPNMTYGFALAGGGTNWNLAQGLGSGRSDSFQAGMYAKTHGGPFYFSGALAFASHWFTTNRIAFGDQLQASFTGQSYAARGEVGYRYAAPITGAIVGVTPYAALQAQDFHTPSYSETDLTGGGFGLSYASINATDTRSELGARFDNLQIAGGMPLILRGRLAWAHDWFTDATALNAVFATLPGSNFTVNGAAPPKNSALTTAAAELHINANWTAIAKFDGDFGAGSQTYGGTGTLRYAW